MLNADWKEVSLSTISNGALEELFQRELNEVCKNIDDENTPAQAAREINLKIKLKPNSDRDHVDIELQCSSKTAPVKTVSSSMYIQIDKGVFKGLQKTEIQNDLFTNVSDITKKQ